MTSERKFHFKPFSLSHHRSTMRVGTDAILLGLFPELSGIKSILEVGTGSGLISLLLANRCLAEIIALDIDEDSVTEARANFDQSPFYYRMKAINDDFNRFAGSTSFHFDLIISNPPFFINDFKPDNEKKKIARHAQTLTYEQICNGAAKLLEDNGKLCLVLPYNQSKLFVKIAREQNLFVQKQQLIVPVAGNEPNRVNLQLGKGQPDKIISEKFVIRRSDGKFTTQYINYLKDYYIAVK